MKKSICLTLIFISFGLFSKSNLSGQDLKIGFKDSIHSNVLNETRKLLIRLPENYNYSNISYPVLFRLDGDFNLFIETVGVIHRLVYMEEIMPEMIVVLIENTDRNRDMLPVNTDFFQAEPGAFKFQKFIETELIPYLDNHYRTSESRILCGQSLSTIFTLFSFLSNSPSFDSFITCSAGFLGCEEYFFNLTESMLKTVPEKHKSIFITQGLKDPLDPEGTMNENVKKIISQIQTNPNISIEYLAYENEGHVPYQSLYHALKFLFRENKKEHL